MRPTGFIADWKPHRKTVELIDQVKAVLDEYRAYGPMTCRQIFYRLVAAHGYEKTDKGYANLCETLGRARRARLIPFSDIRDDGDEIIESGGYGSLAQFVQRIEGSVLGFGLLADLNQPWRVIVITEAAGMVEMVWRMVNHFGATVRSAGGFDSITSKFHLAGEIAKAFRNGRRTSILHIGDHDPSGVHVFRNLKADVCAFLETATDEDPAEMVVFERLAITPAQVLEYGFPTAIAKAKDNRSFEGIGDDPTATAQLEALPPDVLQTVLVEGIRRYFDQDIATEVVRQEDADRDRLHQWWDSRPDFDPQ